MPIPKVCFPLIITLSLASSVTAADWTQFRGPTGQGHADVTGLPTSWSESQNIAWKAEIDGIGWSSPVIAKDRVYLTTAVAGDDEKSQSLRAVCLDAKSGDIVWDIEVFQLEGKKLQVHDKNSHASATPIWEDSRLYVHYGPHGTACLDAEGSIVWTNREQEYKPVHGNGGSPAIASDVLVICCDGSDQRYVVGLNKQTGKRIWRTERELDPSRGFSFSTPTILDVGGTQQAICPGSGGVWSYDPQTGKQLWRVAYGEGYSVVPRPVVGHGMVYVCSGFGDGQLFAIDPTGSGDVTETHVKFTVRKGVPKSPSVLLVGNEIYMVDDKGVASCVDAKSGEMHWQERLAGKYSASPSFADGMIYFQNENGLTTIIKPGTEYSEVGTNTLGDGKIRTFASFGFLQNAILLRTETHLYRIQQ